MNLLCCHVFVDILALLFYSIAGGLLFSKVHYDSDNVTYPDSEILFGSASAAYVVGALCMVMILLFLLDIWFLLSFLSHKKIFNCLRPAVIEEHDRLFHMEELPTSSTPSTESEELREQSEKSKTPEEPPISSASSSSIPPPPPPPPPPIGPAVHPQEQLAYTEGQVPRESIIAMEENDHSRHLDRNSESFTAVEGNDIQSSREIAPEITTISGTE